MTANPEPDWHIAAPPEACLAVLDAIAFGAAGDIDRCCAVLAEAGCATGWLVIVSVDMLASVGRMVPGMWDDWRTQLHERATALNVPDEQLRCSLFVVALAEARDRRADLRVAELQHGAEAGDHDIACVAAQLAGQALAQVYGDRLADHLQAARKLFGGAP